ncbi:hypothetical protein ABZ901_27725 [Actinacidiphila alni]|uniref:hypothetical protein n=1 Tax=Actinacidiphila alni TaxID=380248 RepID=UPI0033DA4F89
MRRPAAARPISADRFANDPRELPASDKAANQAKGSRTPDRWKPPRRAYRCEHARCRTGVKSLYGLTVTPPEKSVPTAMLTECG